LGEEKYPKKKWGGRFLPFHPFSKGKLYTLKNPIGPHPKEGGHPSKTPKKKGTQKIVKPKGEIFLTLYLLLMEN